MNENMSLEELKQQIISIQQRIEEIEKEASQEEEKKTPWQLAGIGGDGYFVDACLDGTIGQGERCTDLDYNAFVQQVVAQGFANAFSVMIQLRQCEGAGERVADGYGWMLNSDGSSDCCKGAYNFSLFPPFPSIELALAAAKSVGMDKIVAAYKFLASGE